VKRQGLRSQNGNPFKKPPSGPPAKNSISLANCSASRARVYRYCNLFTGHLVKALGIVPRREKLGPNGKENGRYWIWCPQNSPEFLLTDQLVWC
jgi:hypothetical protein